MCAAHRPPGPPTTVGRARRDRRARADFGALVAQIADAEVDAERAPRRRDRRTYARRSMALSAA